MLLLFFLLLLLLLLLLWTLLHVLFSCCTDLKTVSSVSWINAGGGQVNHPLAFQVDAHLEQVTGNSKLEFPSKLTKPIKIMTKSSIKIGNRAFTEGSVQPVRRAPPLC